MRKLIDSFQWLWTRKAATQPEPSDPVELHNFLFVQANDLIWPYLILHDAPAKNAKTSEARSQLEKAILLHERVRPFLGVMGMPPAEAGQHSTKPPRLTDGNLDCKELVAGSTLYLPIAVAGGLFSAGDGHALQGDGEVSYTGIECPMDEVVLTFQLHADLHLNTPRAHTAQGWLTFGFDPDLNVAARKALDAMIGLMAEQYNLARVDAIALASLVVDLRITQIVNQVCGVRAVLPHGAIQL